MIKKLKIFFISILAIPSLFACAPINQYVYVEGKINIVTTTTMLGDLASTIGGEHVHVVTLMKPGVNPHSYNPKPSDTRALAKADLVILNGLHLEAKMGEVLLSIKEEKRFIASAILEEEHPESIITNNQGQHDPHIWGDVTNWDYIASSLATKLIALDAANQNDYVDNLNSYHQDLLDLDQYVMNRKDELPEGRRTLITAHDAFAYFGRRYGFDVHSIQGISTQSEASVKDIQDLANLVMKHEVKAIFVETSVPENTIRSVVEAVEVQGRSLAIGGHLYSDSLGDSISGGETYIKMIRHNVDTIVDGLK